MFIKRNSSVTESNEIIPKSITNYIPLPIELTTIAIATACIAVPPLGWYYGIAISAGVVGLSKECLYASRIFPKIAKREEKRKIRDEHERFQVYKAQKKAAEVVVQAVLTGLCYKISSLMVNFFSSKCFTEDKNIDKGPFYITALSLTCCSALSVVISVSFLIKKIIE